MVDTRSVAPETGTEADSGQKRGTCRASTAAAPPVRVCPECGDPVPFNLKQPRQMFCSAKHRDAYQRRIAKRGFRFLLPGLVDRITRNGTRGDRGAGQFAANQVARMLQEWRDEDRVAGRMDPVTYYARRVALGYTD